MELYYQNSKGKKLDFTGFPYLIKDMEELFDFSRGYGIDNGKITFSEEPAEVSLVLNISAENPDEYHAAVDNFYDITEYDVINESFGRLYYGEQYVECYLIGSQKKDWYFGVNYMMNYIRLVAPNQSWIMEKKHVFLPTSKESMLADDGRYDYPFAYPYDYKGDEKGKGHISNLENAACDFEIVVYGPCLNPRIIIAGHTYEVFSKLDTGEYMIIDSRVGTVHRIRTNGMAVNEFDNRRKEQSVFRKIYPGNNLVSWDGTFGFDITLFHERGEPKWS